MAELALLVMFFCWTLATGHWTLVFAAEFDIGEIAVTADKGNERNVLSIPADITVITSDDIKRSSAHTVADLLRSEAGVVIRDMYGNGGQVSVDMRGFGEAAASNCVILIDGRRINNIDMANPDISQISLAQVERIEVQRGGAGVLYGDGAVGGVINIITKKPVVTKFNFFSSFDALSSADLRFGIENNPGSFSFSIDGSHKFSKGYRQHSEMQATDIGARVKADENNNVPGWDISAGYHQDKFELPGNITEADWTAGNYWKAYTWAGSSILVDYGSSNDWYSKASVKKSVFGIKTETEVSLRRRIAKTFMDSWSSYDSRYTTVLGAGEKLTANVLGVDIMGGVEYFRNIYQVSPESAVGIPTTAGDDQKLQRNSTSVFLQAVLPLFSIFSIEAGGRIENSNQQFILESTSMDTGRNDVLNALYAGVNAKISRRMSAYARWSRSYRIPKTDEYIAWGIAYNALLNPQQSEDVDIGLKYAGPVISADLSLFLINTSNEIYYHIYGLFDPRNKNENYPDATVRTGGEIRLGVKPFSFAAITVVYTLMDARFAANSGVYPNKEIPLVPRHKGNIGVELGLPLGINAGINCIMVSDRWFGSDYTQTGNMLPGYAVVDINFWKQFGNVRLFGAVTNIADTRYAETGMNMMGANFYYPSPPRNYQLGVDINL